MTSSTAATRPSIKKKLVIIGDDGCGKTCLQIAFRKNEFPEFYVPILFENDVADIYVDDQHVQLLLRNTQGQEEYDQLLALSYSDNNVVLLCFSIDNPDSFQNVSEKWKPEVAQNLPHVPIILVATKKDLRYDCSVVEKLAKTNQRPVSQQDGLSMKDKIGAYAYLECSSKTREGVKEVFETATRAALETQRQENKSKCVVCKTCYLIKSSEWNKLYHKIFCSNDYHDLRNLD